MKIQINNEEIKNAYIIDDLLYFLYNKQIYSVNPNISQLNQITKYTVVGLDIMNLLTINEIFDEFFITINKDKFISTEIKDKNLSNALVDIFPQKTNKIVKLKEKDFNRIESCKNKIIDNFPTDVRDKYLDLNDFIDDINMIVIQNDSIEISDNKYYCHQNNIAYIEHLSED